ncbi:hypothetical protein [Nonomuraea monospora]|uniref:hypothetical protein n=1 Tax=Nonomuraea monospora TaxID=568818 RepID=UPI0031E06A71
MTALVRYLHGDGDTLTAAGAGIALSPGFVTARLHGARGDRRDAVLAAVQILGLDGLHRLGERAGVLVALFGAEATKPLAAAAGQAIAEGRWAALQLASAASGVLGAEQLVRLLTLDGPPIDPTPDAAASTMAAHLGRLLTPYSGRRRLDLLLDLWQRVAARQQRLRRDQRRRATQGKHSRLDELTTRYRTHDDALLLDQLRQDLGHEPTVAEAARWFPYAWQAEVSLNRTLADALAATALVRTAANVGDHGVVQGMNRSTALLTAAARAISQEEARAAARRVPGLTGLPARPGCYVRDLAAQLGNPAEQYVRQRLARAAEYAEILLDVATDRLIEFRNQLGGWPSVSLRDWRAGVGYLTGRDPARWAQPPVGGGRPPLAERLRARPGVPPAEEETAGDLFWYAELADALAQLNGHEQADVEYGAHYPYTDHDPLPDDDRQLVPSLDSLPAALAGAAQLVSFGGQPPRQCRAWPELTDRLLAALGVTQRLTTAFRVPEPLLALDGTVLPGTEVRLRFARNARTLTQWATYMGNCIASLPYVEAAEQGESALVALLDEDGRIVVNVKLDQHVRGWRAGEMRARFNADPDLELRRLIVAWAAALPSAPAEEPVPDPEGERLPPARPAFRRRADRTFQEVGGPLARLAADALAAGETVDALRVLHAPDGAPPAEVLTSLRRLSADRVERLCRNKLQAVGLPALWRATSVRPLERALTALPSARTSENAPTTSRTSENAPTISRTSENAPTTARASEDILPPARASEDVRASARAPEYTGGRPQLALLLLDAPLPGSLRKLARHDAIAPARSMELVARRIRAALGRLARAGDPALAHQVARRADTAVLCSLVVAVTSWPPDPALPTVAVSEPGRTSVPGFPRSDLDDPSGPWQRALPGAVELGADLDAFRDRVAGAGLHVPVAWLGHGGWNALWQRAAR